jgi:hypothetical protein
VAKKAKKSEQRDLAAEVDRLIKEVGDDRDLLLGFLEGLISEYDGEKAVGIAEYVAKLADALTRQHQVKAAVVKALAKASPSSDEDEDELDELQDKIGLPFKVEEIDDGAN